MAPTQPILYISTPAILPGLYAGQFNIIAATRISLNFRIWIFYFTHIQDLKNGLIRFVHIQNAEFLYCLLSQVFVPPWHISYLLYNYNTYKYYLQVLC